MSRFSHTDLTQPPRRFAAKNLGQEGHHGGQARQRGRDRGANAMEAWHLLMWLMGKGCNMQMEKHGFPQKKRSQITPKNSF